MLQVKIAFTVSISVGIASMAGRYPTVDNAGIFDLSDVLKPVQLGIAAPVSFVIGILVITKAWLRFRAFT